MCVPQLHYPEAVAYNIMDDTTLPCTDFYRHACGKWNDAHTNEGRSFTAIRRRNEFDVEEIVRDPTVEGVSPFFSSCRVTLASTGAERARHMKDTAQERIYMMERFKRPLVHNSDLPSVFADMVAHGYTAPIALTVEKLPNGPGVILQFAYDGFEFITAEDEAWVRSHFEVLEGEGSEAAARKARNLVAFLVELNASRPDISGLATYDGYLAYITGTDFAEDVMPFSQFKALSTSFDWDAFLSALSRIGKLDHLTVAPEKSVCAFRRSYFQAWNPSAYTVQQWQLFVEWSVLYNTHDFFPDLPNDVFVGPRDPKARNSLYLRHRWRKRRSPRPPPHGDRRRDSREAPPPPPPTQPIVTERDCVHATTYMIPGLLSKEFLRRHFPNGEQTRTRVGEVVERIRTRFAALIQATPWMDDTTKERQVTKISSIVSRIVHPNEWEAEGFGTQMDPERYLRTLNIVRKERVKRNLDLWAESNSGSNCDAACRDRIAAFEAPLSRVNAWYNPLFNTITIPAGILRFPFYNQHYDSVSLYATIGMVVAHELSHGEDPVGSRFDWQGSIADTWSAEARQRYRQRAQCIVNEYGSPAECVNAEYGTQTLCEDVADINGIRLAYEALFLGDPDAPRDAGALKRFFYAFAQMWCESYDQEATCRRVSEDVHAIARFRVQKTLMHLPYFATAFGCSATSLMVKTDAERCVIYGPEATPIITIEAVVPIEKKKKKRTKE